MSDLSPEIWDNKELGLAAQNRNLSVEEEQARENRSAELEGREPRTVVHEGGYPNWQNYGEYRASYQKEVHFEDEQENDIPRGDLPEGEPVEEIEANEVGEETSEENSLLGGHDVPSTTEEPFEEPQAVESENE